MALSYDAGVFDQDGITEHEEKVSEFYYVI